MGLTATYNLEPMVRGDQWRGVALIRITVDGVPPATQAVSARMQWRRSPGAAAIGHSIDSDDGITILDDDAWTFAIVAQALPLAAGVWHYDFETTDSVGRVRTYISGTHEIQQDTSR